MARNNQELAHHWAHQVQPSDRGSSFFYNGAKIYSFGYHFCIARLLPDGVVVYGTHRWSGSYTSRHQSLVRQAVSDKKIVYCNDPDATAKQNMAKARADIAEALEQSESKRRREDTRASLKARALRVAEEINEYLEALPANERAGVEPIDLATLDHIREEAAKARELALKVEEEQRARELVKQQERLGLWRQHMFDGYLGMYVPAALRLSKDRTAVETSRGASIPVTHAKRLWNYICDVRANPKKEMDYGDGMRLGNYRLTKIEADGSIVVGCHNIAYSEIEGIAHELGLTDTSEAQRAWDKATKKG